MSITSRRVLFACVPQAGHLRPLLPLATELSAAGDEVIFASGPSVTGDVERAGFGFRVVGTDLGDWFGRLAERTRGQPGAGLPPEHVERYFVPRLFAEIALDATLDDLGAVVDEWRPDVVVADSYAFAATLVAAVHGVPSVEHGIGLPFDPLVRELVADAVTPAWNAAGLPAPGPAPATLCVDVCPPALAGELAASAPRARQPVRPAPLPVREPAALPFELPHPDLPLVYVTFGTFANSDVELFRVALRALAELPVSVLVTTGDEDVAAGIEDVPDNAVVAGFVPQAAILPRCSAVVHHAGAGTTFGLLAHALPSVAAPQSADNFAIARHLAAAGAAIVLPPGEVVEKAVRDAVVEVLARPEPRTAAQRLAGEIAAMPAPADVVPAIHALADRKEPS
jgi:UDP:flavonoid glycosyltransferase YjiC (YdhE family)